jgi:hypothetical protein
MKLGKHIVIVSTVAFSVSAAACSVKKNSSDVDGGLGAGVGVACNTTNDCRARLICDNTSKTCVPNPTVLRDGACILSAECLAGNYCAQTGVCAASGSVPANGVCSSEADCANGLQCALSGLVGVCQPGGSRDIGAGCTQTAECMAGLLCIGGVCGKGIGSPWLGVVCPADDEDAKILFHVPRASDSPVAGDFYRLPFPNDIRIKNGKVSLTGHPKPGPRILPFDIVERYLSAIEAEATGFGANQAVYFRLSREFNAATFPGDCGINLVDITPGSPTYGLSQGAACGAQVQSSTYVCGPFLWLRPPVGRPLRPGTTYVATLRKALTDITGRVFGPDGDFSAMLDPAHVPADPDLAVAYAAYKPLRDYIAAVPTFKDDDSFVRIAATDLAAAAVFTVEKYEDPLAAIDNAIAGLPAPVVTSLVRCGDPGAVSPCDDQQVGAAHVRGCLPQDSADPSFDTYQGLVSLPVFQKGTPPYLSPTDGGNIEYQRIAGGNPTAASPDGGDAVDGGGGAVEPMMAAVLQRTEKVCFALTVPKGTPPATGWPLLVYAHGTGGSYRSILDSGLAPDFAAGTAPAGYASTVGAAPIPTAVLGYDGILHGTRAGGSTQSVGALVYNFLNPQAARDNALQAAADLMAIPRALPGFAGLGLPIDEKRVVLYGHSQGGNGASLVAARESRYRTIVMSGTGGMLIYTLLGKTQPVNVPANLPYLLGEIRAVDANHPVLNLMQMYFERSDSVNFGRRLLREPLAEMTPHHILHVFGTKDSYSVVETQRAYATSADLRVVGPAVDNFGLLQIAGPARDNDLFGGRLPLTVAQVQYQPDPAAGYDGHFVSTRNPSARAAIQEMVITTFRDGSPTVVP